MMRNLNSKLVADMFNWSPKKYDRGSIPNRVVMLRFYKYTASLISSLEPTGYLLKKESIPNTFYFVLQESANRLKLLHSNCSRNAI